MWVVLAICMAAILGVFLGTVFGTIGTVLSVPVGMVCGWAGMMKQLDLI